MSQELKVQFDRVLKTPTQFPQDMGLLEVTVTNSGDEAVFGTSLKLFASTDAVLDAGVADNVIGLDAGVLNTNDDFVPGSSSIKALQGTDAFLGKISNIILEAGESKKITIDFSTDDFQTPSVVSAGGYNLIAKIDPYNAVGEANEVDNESVKYISTLKTDQVLDWNSVFLNISQTEGKNDLANDVKLTDTEVPGIAPPLQARDAAILHLAIYDAVNGVKGNHHEPYLPDLDPPAPATASASAATIGAAYTVLSELYPDYQDLLDEQLDRSLQELKGPVPFFVKGFNFGTGVANKLLDLRADDGADQAQVPYESDNRPGEYSEKVGIDAFTGDLAGDSSLFPNWGDVTPFALGDIEDFTPDGPPKYGTSEFDALVEEVSQLGGRFDTAATTLTRTEDQTEIAQFWAYDRVDTFRPPGQLFEVAQDVALQEGNTLEENALLFAQLSTAFADAGIVAWDTKYDVEQARPINSVRELLDPEWRPLLNTPPFPDYISGHSTFGGVAATVLENFFGDDVSFDVTSQELPGVVRHYSSVGDVSSFDRIAIEDANSRLYGGVHYANSNYDGVATGMAVADYILDNHFGSAEIM
jgi:hypothetical protein